MAKIDQIKEQIGWLKIAFGILSAIDISLIGYLFNKIEVLSTIQITIILVGLIVATLAIIYINKNAMLKIDSLEEL